MDRHEVPGLNGEAVLWNQSEALALFKALQKDKAVPSGLLSGTQVG